MIRAVGIICKRRQEDLCSVVPPLVEWLRERKLEVFLDESAAASCSTLEAAATEEMLVTRSDLVIVLGGDGTLLAAARLLQNREVPILPVNLGSLGFMTSVTLEELYPLLEQTLAGTHRVSERMTLQAEVFRQGSATHVQRALNDAVVNQAALARLMEFNVHVGGSHVGRYRADGLIIATPTGSTAYSLAAGGPIVHPDIHAFVITPICPHMLTNRPLVVPDASRIEVAFTHEGEPVHITLDGQVGIQLERDDRIVITKSPNRVLLVQSPKKSYFEVLRSKLRWGEQ
ncbi:MAG TPA: NAD(+)/NADH kinase [Candidatus Acidoferrales bacterium]|nr:NAD(+)/NADH kinase [Candidatus Acidoferrales bacterium]